MRSPESDETDASYRSVIAALQEGIVIFAADGTVRSCNPAAERILGVREAQIAGHAPIEAGWRAIHDDGRPFSPESDPSQMTLRTGRACSNVVMGLQRLDGSLAWISVNTEPLPGRDGIVASLVEITARRQAEVALRDSEHRWRSFTETLPQLVWACDLTGALTYASAQWLDFAGKPERDLLSWGWAALLHPDDREQTLARWRAAMIEGDSFELEHRLLRHDGAWRWFQSRSRPLHDSSGAITGWLGTSTDVSDLRQARDTAESANRAKDDFLANVSHEIRTPMNAILGMTELALDSELGSEQRDWLRTVKSAGENLLTIIDSLLDFAKVAANKVELDSAPFSLRSEISETLRALAVRAQRKGLQLTGEVAEDVPDQLLGDAGRLRQVLINLVGNAIKFTSEGEVVLGVTADPGAEVRLRITVRDTGIGIPREKHGVIFEAFAQEDNSTTRKYGGTGLGLTIAARLAALMQGGITVESAPGQGSTFTFTAVLARAEAPAPVEVPRPLSMPAGPSLRVLVAEDNDFNAELVQKLLLKRGHRPRLVASGGEALSVLESEPFDLLLLDLHMPGMDGFQVIERLRERGARLPVIALTARSRPEDRARCFAAGMDGFLVKPLNSRALWAEIDRVSGPDRWLDPVVLLAACGGEPAILESLKASMRSWLPEALGKVRTSLRQGDAQALREAAHSLLGTVATVSSTAARLASALEDAAAKGDLVRAETFLKDLEAAVDAIVARIGVVTLERLTDPFV